ncbi:DUF4390 domain-containing protein [Candidatus Magnetaquicoccus inordinatus]|uniref:DUF4390 domain-containing protein n=1 Tax=Candidatus Magnetaquicoccus inordinatus TaxID=2496818 RepID=UPI00187D6D07|nr:DUF4390 domain-containing protein [Candidatus Magnetaquicoccus inordinatus]
MQCCNNSSRAPLQQAPGKLFHAFPAVLIGLIVLLLPLAGCTDSKEMPFLCQGSHLLTCRENKAPTQPGVIQQAALFKQGDKLYVRAELDSTILKRLMEFLNNGEPLWATYRFRLYQQNSLLPDLRLAQTIVKRRLRFRLITHRFEMLDGQSGQIQYTGNPDEAMNFLGAPRYIAMATLHDKKSHLSSRYNYRLKVDLTLEQEDLSHLFHLLDQWFNLGQSGQFYLHTPYLP